MACSCVVCIAQVGVFLISPIEGFQGEAFDESVTPSDARRPTESLFSLCGELRQYKSPDRRGRTPCAAALLLIQCAPLHREWGVRVMT